jgi:hypothetical protein
MCTSPYFTRAVVNAPAFREQVVIIWFYFASAVGRFYLNASVIGDCCEIIGVSSDRKLLQPEPFDFPCSSAIFCPLPYSPTIPIHIYPTKENENSAVNCESSFRHELEFGSVHVYLLGLSNNESH